MSQHTVVMQNTPKTKQKRSRSSEGETPRPDCKQTKMAEKVSDELRAQISLIATSVKEIKDGQDSMKRMVESKIDKLRSDVLSTIDEKIRVLKSDLDLDIGRESRRIDDLMNSVHTLTSRFDQFEQNAQGDEIPNGGVGQGAGVSRGLFNVPLNPLNNNDVTVIAKDLPYIEGEDLLMTARNLIATMGEDVYSNVNVVAASRMRARYRNKPGLVKISLANVEQKILVLRNKRKLRDSAEFKRVYLEGAKSHVERLIEINTRAILRELPQGRAYRFAGNGRLLRRQNQTGVDNADNADNMDAQQAY